MNRRLWPWIVGLVLCAAAFGLAFALDTVSREGWGGLWNRKKDSIKGIQPAAGPAIDAAEERVMARP